MSDGSMRTAWSSAGIIGYARLVARAAIACLLAGCVARGGLSHVEATVGEREASVEHVEVGGVRRRYLLHAPTAASEPSPPSDGFPLLILLHGSNAEGRVIEQQSGMDAIANRYGVVVAYPDGARSLLGRSTADWNAGDCCGWSQRHQVDDVSFLRAIMDELAARSPIDAKRVYVAGFSDGGRMAYRAACELGDRVAAIAVVSGSLEVAGCRPARGVALLAIHGTGDTDVPYGAPTADSMIFAGPPGAEGTPPSVRYWARLGGCTSYREDLLPRRWTHGTFGGCNRGDVALYRLDGGPHAWPGAMAAPDASRAEHAVPASEVMLRFLLAHRH